jgi:hypothetical protein
MSEIYSEFFLGLAIGFCMLIFQPPVNFCSDENIQTIFGIKLEDFLNYRIDAEQVDGLKRPILNKKFRSDFCVEGSFALHAETQF